MTVHVVSNSGGYAGIYTGQELSEYGDDANCIWGGKSNYEYFSNLYWKLGEKGLYYIKLTGRLQRENLLDDDFPAPAG